MEQSENKELDKEKDKETISVYMDKVVSEKIRSMAIEDRRSISAEITFIIEKYIAEKIK